MPDGVDTADARERDALIGRLAQSSSLATPSHWTVESVFDLVFYRMTGGELFPTGHMAQVR